MFKVYSHPVVMPSPSLLDILEALLGSSESSGGASLELEDVSNRTQYHDTALIGALMGLT